MRETDADRRLRVLHVKGKMCVDGASMISYRMAEQLRDSVCFDWYLKDEDEAEDDGGMAGRFRALGSRMYYPPQGKGALSRLWNDYQFFRRCGYRVVQIDTDNLKRWRIAALAALAGIPRRIMHVHSTGTEAVGKAAAETPKLRLMQGLNRLFSTDYFACSPEAGRYMFGEKGVGSPRFQVIANGLDAESYRFSAEKRAEVRASLGTKADAVVLGFVGRLAPVKNPGFVLDVFRCFHEKRRDSELWMAGTGEMREELKQKARDMGLADRVKILGVRKDVPALMQGMDALLLPSQFEGLGMAAIEAQAAGLPAYLSQGVARTAGVTDLASFLPLEDGPERWAAYISEDLTKHRRLDRTAEIRAAGYDIRAVAEKMEALYRQGAGK